MRSAGDITCKFVFYGYWAARERSGRSVISPVLPMATPTVYSVTLHRWVGSSLHLQSVSVTIITHLASLTHHQCSAINTACFSSHSVWPLKQKHIYLRAFCRGVSADLVLVPDSVCSGMKMHGGHQTLLYNIHFSFYLLSLSWCTRPHVPHSCSCTFVHCGPNSK